MKSWNKPVGLKQPIPDGNSDKLDLDYRVSKPEKQGETWCQADILKSYPTTFPAHRTREFLGVLSGSTVDRFGRQLLVCDPCAVKPVFGRENRPAVVKRRASVGKTQGSHRASVKQPGSPGDIVMAKVILFSSFEKRAGAGVPGSLDSKT